jgi:hypothetical protein
MYSICISYTVFLTCIVLKPVHCFIYFIHNQALVKTVFYCFIYKTELLITIFTKKISYQVEKGLIFFEYQIPCLYFYYVI